MNLKKIIRETLEKTLQENTHFMDVENDAIRNHFQRQKSRASIVRFAQFIAKDAKPYYITQENGQALFKVFAPTESGLAPIAYLYLHPNKDYTIYTPDAGKADAVQVNPEHRRKGIAMALYDFAEKEAGLTIQPSTVQAPEIQAMWKKRKDLEEVISVRRTQDFPDFYDTLYNPLRKNMAYPPKTGIVTMNAMRETEELDRMLKGKNYSIHLLAKKLASQLGYKDVWPLGTGTAGYAFSIGDGKVMKITPDFSEYSNAKKILNKKTKHLADIYGTYRLTKDLDGIYVIISEHLDFDSDRLYELDDDVTASIRYLRNEKPNWTMLPKDAGLMFHGVLKDTYSDNYIKEVRQALIDISHISDEALWYFDQMIGMMKEMREYKITSTDFGLSNVGLKKDGSIGFYDLGYAKEELAYKGQEDLYGMEVQQERKNK